MEFSNLLTVTFTLFAVIDIIGNVPVLVSLKEKIGDIHALKASGAALVLMLFFFLVGERFLGLMGIDVSSFAVAGSIVLFIIGLEMILGIELMKGDDMDTGTIVPVAFPLIAGTGTLTTIISLKADFERIEILGGILINILLVFLVLKSLRRIEKLLGRSGLMVIRKFFGVVLLAISVKIFQSNVVNF